MTSIRPDFQTEPNSHADRRLADQICKSNPIATPAVLQ